MNQPATLIFRSILRFHNKYKVKYISKESLKNQKMMINKSNIQCRKCFCYTIYLF